LYILANQVVKNRNQLIGLGIVPHLLKLCPSEDKGVRKSSVTCLANVSELSNFVLIQDDLPNEMKNRELIKMLIAILVSEEQVEILDEAAFALANLGKDCIF
jgi:HEAT repeat protein